MIISNLCYKGILTIKKIYRIEEFKNKNQEAFHSLINFVFILGLMSACLIEWSELKDLGKCCLRLLVAL